MHTYKQANMYMQICTCMCLCIYIHICTCARMYARAPSTTKHHPVTPQLRSNAIGNPPRPRTFQGGPRKKQEKTSPSDPLNGSASSGNPRPQRRPKTPDAPRGGPGGDKYRVRSPPLRGRRRIVEVGKEENK